MSTPVPTLAGYLVFIRDFMGIDPDVLPDDSPWIESTFDFASAQVNTQLQTVPLVYLGAVYNLGGSLLLNFAQDVEGQTYFKDLRAELHLTAFVPGVILSAADVTTSDSFVVADFFKNLTIGDLQRLKDPYGRQYLDFAQQAGPTIWGIS